MAELKPTTPQVTANCYANGGTYGSARTLLQAATAGSYGIPHVWSNGVDSMAISDAWRIAQLTAMNSNLWQTRAPNSYSVWS